MLSKFEVFSIALFTIVFTIYEILLQGIITLETLRAIFSGNIITYISFVASFIYFRKQQTGRNSDLERSILALNNELQRMRTESEWRNDAVSQGKCLAIM
jgi:hypothetical protein